jgi:energy-coupling factor transport system substrate-specific component
MDGGLTEAAARIGRSTVYDAFRTGRSRLNASLVGEIVCALGLSDEQAAAWRERCANARKASPAPAAEHAPAFDSAPTDVGSYLQKRPPRLSAPVILLLAIAVNLLGSLLRQVGHLPIHGDMIGTALVSIVLGPWAGALAGVVTQTALVPFYGTGVLPFAFVQVVGALIWGYGARAFGLTRSMPRMAVLNLVTGFCCTLVAVPILLGIFDGQALHASIGQMVETFRTDGYAAAGALFTSNLIVSLIDKMLSGFVALAIAHSAALISRPGSPAHSRFGSADFSL